MTPFYVLPFLGAGQFKLSDMLLVAGIVLVTTSLLMIYRKRKRRTVSSLTAREQLERMQQHRGMRGDLEDLMVEIEQMAKRLGSQLDAKTIQLEQAMREADRRIERLELLKEAASQSDQWQVANHTVESDNEGVLPGNAPSESLAKAVYALADQGLTSVDIAKQLNELVGKIELILALRKA